jgi:hypothetical protein
MKGHTYAMTMSPSRSFIWYVSASLGESMQARLNRLNSSLGNLVSCLQCQKKVTERGRMREMKSSTALLWTIEKMSLDGLLVDE